MNSAVDRYLELWNVTKAYPGRLGPVTIVRDFNLIMRQGEFVSIIGHSGCGKSTILSIVAGLNDLTSGGVVLAGREIDGAGPDRGVVFQSPSLLPWLTAFGNVMLGVEQVQSSLPRSARAQLVEHYLTLVGLGESLHKRPAELSQGMRQRVGLARAFALNPKMLLLDEPFGMLDSLTRFELQQVLIDLWSQDQKTALMVTHDVDEALFLSDRIVMMTNGPEARVGDILTVPFARPRNRSELLEDPEYYRLREQLVSFLEAQHATPGDHSAAVQQHSPRSGQLTKVGPEPDPPLVHDIPLAVTTVTSPDFQAASPRNGRAPELCRMTLR
ncbi:MAG: ABC transporter ATP-binding protein [Planctomycetales bacterium]|nr:ABC transporter ATP-binding protein [Planctomycetales bacterium]